MNNTEKITVIFLRALIAISAVLIVILFAGIDTDGQTPAATGWIGANLVWAYILIIAGAVLAVASGVYQLATDFKAARKALVAAGAFVIVLFISFLFASSQLPQFFGVEKYIDSGILTAATARLIDTGLYSTYILLALAVLAVVLSPVYRFLK